VGTWVRLKGIKYVEIQGKQHTFHKGDWVEVGQQTAMAWVAEDMAEIPDVQQFGTLLTNDAGVFAVSAGQVESNVLGVAESRLAFRWGAVRELPWTHTLLWEPGAKLRPEILPAGFDHLKTWQIGTPLWDAVQLACNVGSEAERERTQRVIRDLRVPLYDQRLVFVRRCGDTEEFLYVWEEERAAGGDEKLAFLRALYRQKPLVLALPTWWSRGERPPPWQGG
jgi:hypothetical protein